MALCNIAGNERIRQRLMETVRTGTISHAYVLEGDPETDKKKMAKEFAKAILCLDQQQGDACDLCVNCKKMDHENYEDYIEICRDGNSIKDEAILSLQGELTKKPYAGSRHVAVIEDADTMTLRAQNRILKTLEEPTPGTVILLLSENVENLVPTILSRCIVFRLQSVGVGDDGSMSGQSRIFAELAVTGAPFYQLSAALGEAAQKKELALVFLNSLEKRYRDLAICGYDKQETLLFEPKDRDVLRTQGRLLKADRLSEAIAAIEEARRDLNRNINTAYALKSMILKLY